MTIQYDYLKRINSQYYAGITEEYIRGMFLKLSENTVVDARKRLIAAVKKFVAMYGDLDIMEITPEHVKAVRDNMAEYTENYRKFALVEFCKMVCHYQGDESLYEEVIGTHVKRVREIHADCGEFLFGKELDEYIEYKLSEGVTPGSCHNIRNQATNACMVLNKTKNITRLEQIDSSCIEFLQEFYMQYAPRIYMNYLGSLRGFVKYITGYDVFTDKLEKCNTLYKIPEGPEKDVFVYDLNRYLEDERERNLHKNHIMNLRTKITNCYLKICEVYGLMFPKNIDYHIFRGIQCKFEDLKQVTVQAYLSALNHMLHFCYGIAPLEAAKLVWSIGEPRRTYMDPEEWKTLYDVANPPTRMILVLGGMLGLRRNEIANVKLTDFDGGDLRVRGKGHGIGKEYWIEIDENVQIEIDSYLKYRDELCQKYPDHSHGNLLIYPHRGRLVPMTVDYVYDLLKYVCDKMHINASCHTLRRLYGTTLIENGEDLDVVQSLMRHADISTTILCYKRDNKARKRQAGRRLGRTFFG